VSDSAPVFAAKVIWEGLEARFHRAHAGMSSLLAVSFEGGCDRLCFLPNTFSWNLLGCLRLRDLAARTCGKRSSFRFRVRLIRAHESRKNGCIAVDRPLEPTEANCSQIGWRKLVVMRKCFASSFVSNSPKPSFWP
jgi:hypothetical protein